MIGLVSCELKPKIRLHGCADVRRASVVDGPAAVFVLVSQDVVRALLETLLVAGTKQRVHQDVVGFECRIGFEFAAPVAVFVLLGEKPFAGAVNRGGDAGRKVIDFSEAELGGGGSCRGKIVHTDRKSTRLNSSH